MPINNVQGQVLESYISNRDTNNRDTSTLNQTISDFEAILSTKLDSDSNLYTGRDSIYLRNRNSDSLFLTIAFYLNGELLRMQHCYGDNSLKYDVSYQNKKKNGIALGYYKNGKLSREEYWIDGVPDHWTLWHKNGSLKETFTSNEFMEHKQSWYRDGSIKSKVIVDFKNDERITESEWCSNGRQKFEILQNCGKQPYLMYNCAGIKIVDATIVDMSLFYVGDLTQWYDNGQKMMEWHFKKGSSRKEANFRIGTWLYWNENGDLIKKEYYENNKLIKTEEFLPGSLKE